MMTVASFLASLQTHFDSQDAAMESIGASISDSKAAIDLLGTSLTGISGDVAWLKEQIAKLQTTQGSFTPEDQAIVDALQTRIDSLSNKTATAASELGTTTTALTGAASSLKALDDLTPPAPPTPTSTSTTPAAPTD